MSVVTDQEQGPRLGWRTVAFVLVLFTATIVVGARPRGNWDPNRQYPSFIGDSLQHIWVMRWHKMCLIEGRSPLACPDVEYPVGAPPGNFSPMPACYDTILKADPAATFVEVNGDYVNAVTGYWQSVHRGRCATSFSGLLSKPFLNLIMFDSPFTYNHVEDPNYLAGSVESSFELLSRARFNDYTRLFLKANDLRYVVVPKGGSDGQWNPTSVPRLDALMDQARIFEDEATSVYATDRLPKPTRPVLLCLHGWKSAWAGQTYQEARLLVYSPDPDPPLRLRVKARATSESRAVRLLDGEGRELARWQIRGDVLTEYQTPEFRLPEGLARLTLASDGEARLSSKIDDLDPGPFSLRVIELGLTSMAVAPALASVFASDEIRHGRRTL